jgi:hypothetical protein
MDWFETLFGFKETTWDATRAGFAVDDETLASRWNGRSFRIGRFGTPTLGELRAGPAATGVLQARHEWIDDALALHALPENEGATFQVASQFNCLEFVDESVVPEDGVTGYENDPTQGPACSLAAAPATVYRNYFAPVGEASGQTRERQLDNLAGVLGVLGPDLVRVTNGYTLAGADDLARLGAALATQNREALMDRLAIGYQSGVEVTFGSRFIPPPRVQLVSQAFCSAVSCSYAEAPLDAWEPLATLVLDAAYEATLRAAACDAAEGRGSGKVWLTFLGGGAFGNRRAWIAQAIARALRQCAHLALDVRIAHYRWVDPEMVAAIDAGLR